LLYLSSFAPFVSKKIPIKKALQDSHPGRLFNLRFMQRPLGRVILKIKPEIKAHILPTSELVGSVNLIVTGFNH
jgi:hypothetical protein